MEPMRAAAFALLCSALAQAAPASAAPTASPGPAQADARRAERLARRSLEEARALAEKGVAFERGMAQSESALQSPRLWYDIKLQLHAGRPVTLGSHVASRREAEWLVEEIRRLPGLGRPPGPAAGS